MQQINHIKLWALAADAEVDSAIRAHDLVGALVWEAEAESRLDEYLK